MPGACAHLLLSVCVREDRLSCRQACCARAFVFWQRVFSACCRACCWLLACLAYAVEVSFCSVQPWLQAVLLQTKSPLCLALPGCCMDCQHVSLSLCHRLALKGAHVWARYYFYHAVCLHCIVFLMILCGIALREHRAVALK